MAFKWLARLELGTPNLSRVTVEKETPKTIKVKDLEHVIGWNWARVINKESDNVFDTFEEAADYLIGKMENTIKGYEESVTELKGKISKLEQLKGMKKGQQS